MLVGRGKLPRPNFKACATMKQMEVVTKSLKETRHFASNVVEDIIAQGKDRKNATVSALFGELGSGKTSFVQGAARALGIQETVVSPTFIIERIYKLSNKLFSHFIHIDCYRLENSEELKKLGWDDIVTNPRNIIFVEWAEKVEEILPKNTIKIYFGFVDENTRKISVV